MPQVQFPGFDEIAANADCSYVYEEVDTKDLFCHTAHITPQQADEIFSFYKERFVAHKLIGGSSTKYRHLLSQMITGKAWVRQRTTRKKRALPEGSVLDYEEVSHEAIGGETITRDTIMQSAFHNLSDLHRMASFLPYQYRDDKFLEEEKSNAYTSYDKLHCALVQYTEEVHGNCMYGDARVANQGSIEQLDIYPDDLSQAKRNIDELTKKPLTLHEGHNFEKGGYVYWMCHSEVGPVQIKAHVSDAHTFYITKKLASPEGMNIKLTRPQIRTSIDRSTYFVTLNNHQYCLDI